MQLRHMSHEMTFCVCHHTILGGNRLTEVRGQMATTYFSHKSAGLHVEQRGERLSKTARVHYRRRASNIVGAA